jgi:pyruvate formate lyase activating enzyme
MHGTIFDIKRFAVHDGPGIRTTVFFKGCPLNCFWCHNPESISCEPFQTVRKIRIDDRVFDQPENVGREVSVNEIMTTIRKDRMFMEESDGGVTFSGGEPTMQPAFLKQLLIACKEEGFHTAVDTCGYTSCQTMAEIIPYTDLFLFDLKHVDSEKHLAFTGKSNDVIMENFSYIIESKKKIRVRIPVIPVFNFLEDDLEAICDFLSLQKDNIDQIDLLPFHTIAQNKYKRFGLANKMEGIKGVSKDDIANAKKLFEKEGFKVKIGG